MFDQQSFIDFIIENQVVGFFDSPITLKSGRKSNWYVNWRSVFEDVYLLDKVTEYIFWYVYEKKLKIDTFYGVPEGASKLGILCQYKWALAAADYAKGSHILSMGRAVPKQHGAKKDKYFLGLPEGKVLVIEDTTTTGLSIINTINHLLDNGREVCGALLLTNRMERRDDGKSVRQAIEETGVPYHCLSQATDFLSAVVNRLKPSTEIIQAIRTEFQEVGIADPQI